MKPTLLSKLLFTTLLTCAAVSIDAKAQIAYSENFAGGSGGWSTINTFSYGDFHYANLQTCSSTSGCIYGSAGSYASPGFWQYFVSSTVSPVVGNTLGGAISASFTCSRQGAGTNAIVTLAYGHSPTGPWITMTTGYPIAGGSCFQVTAPTMTVAEPGPLYLKLDVNILGNNSQEGTTSSIYIDSIAVFEAALPVCNGVPTGGTTASSIATACSGPTFSLTVSPSPNQTGLSYQWEKSTNGTAWTAIAGATTKYISANQTAATYYRRKTTCAGSGVSAWSTSLLVAQAANPFACYCASGAYAPQYADITNVVVGTLSNACPYGSLVGNQYTATGVAGQYSNWTASGVTVPDLPRAVTVPFSVNLYSYSPVNPWTKVYVDFNSDGDLEDAGEMVYSGNVAVYFGTQLSGSMTVPVNAVLGNTLMRVVCNSSAGSAADVSPCGGYDYGETEDYRVNIVPTTNCGGVPATPVASGPAVVCDFNQAFALNATNLPASTATAVGYQWQKSAPGANSWMAIAGATTVPYTVVGQSSSTDYRLVVTCSASGQSAYSNVVAVGVGTSSTCYCASVITSASACQRWISGVTTTGAVTNMTNTSACTLGGFADYATSVAGPVQYQDYPLNLSLTSANGRTAWSIYVDYNNDAAFTNDELVYQNNNTTGGTMVAASFVVPLNATPGTHRMRVRADSGATAATACTATISGETEDYTLTVLQKPACTGTPASATISTTQPYIYCGPFPDKPITLVGGTATGTSGVTGISTTWERSMDSSFNSIISQYSSTIGQNASGFYRAKQTCASSGLSAYSNSILVANHTPTSVTISPASPAFCAGSGGVMLTANVSAGPGSPTPTYTWFGGGSACSSCISCTTCSNPVVNPTVSATFVVQASVSSCPTVVTANKLVTVTPLPTVVSAIAPAAACSGGSITLSGQTDTPGIYSGFAGPFAPAMWTFSQTTSNGSVITSGAPSAVVFISSDSTAISPTDASDSWSVNVTQSGNITFDWTYSTVDSAAYDFVRYSPNSSVFTDLPGFSRTGAKNQSGTAVIPVTAGSVFMLRGRSLTNSGGSSTTTISNFSAPGGLASTVTWYDAPTGGNLLANPITISVPGSYTYYAQAVSAAGCVSLSRLPSNAVTVHPAGRWTGAVDSNWSTAGNWCGGIPTVTSNLVIPGAITVPNLPVLSTTGSANNIELQTGSSLKVSGTGTLNVYGGFSGAGAFNAGAGTVSFAGTAPQSIPAGITVGTLAVAGGSTKSLSGDAQVNTALNLSNGMVDAGSNTLRLGTGAAITGASASRYVRTSATGGRLQQSVGTTPVVFPVGNTAYNPVTLSNSGTADTFKVGVRDEVLTDGTTGGPVNPLNVQVVNRTWNVEEQTPGGSNVTMKLQWNAGETNNASFDYTNVYVSHSTGSGWDQDPAYPNVNNTPTANGYPGGGPYSALRNGIASFSPFTVRSSVGTPLPVTLVRLTASNVGACNQVAWESASEQGLAAYAVERSADGRTFTPIEKVASIGKAASYLSYDEAPADGLTYYRLRLVELDGSFSDSRVVEAFKKSIGGDVVVQIAPNPVVDMLTVSVYGAADGNVQLTDVVGRVVATASVDGGQATISTATLAAGSYFLKWTNGVASQTFKVSKQ